MLFICFWRLLSITTLLLLLSSRVEATETFYCITHKAGGIHTLEKCSTIATTKIKDRPISAAALTTYNRDVDANSTTLSSTTTTNDNKITFELNCQSDPSTCQGVSTTFQKATDIISSLFQFETPLLINASFINFCTEYNDCGYDGKMTSIGQAYPSISYIMIDNTDNMTRMYPQPLLKQFTSLSVKPVWTKYDINAQFNTQMNWYFVNNPNPINNNQTDFLKNVLHELMHGLGFVTSWTDDLYHGLSPLFPQQQLAKFIAPILLASTNNNQLLEGYNTPQPFWGFVEFPFDKLLSYKSSSDPSAYTAFTSITKKLNQFSNSNILYRNLIDFANSWYTSNEYQKSIQIYQKATNKLNVLANNLLWLETSLNPYSTGSSLCHVDQSEYINSTEYLMIYTASKGSAILNQLNQLFPQGPIGPKLRNIMASLGYKLSGEDYKTIRPSLTYWAPPPGLVGTNSNPSPSLTINTNGPAQSPSSSSSVTTNASNSSSTLIPSSSASSVSKSSSASSITALINSFSICIITISISFLFL